MNDDRDVKPIELDPSLVFPELASDENPDDREALRLIVGAQAAVGSLYARLEKTLRGNRKFLVRMLRRDWSQRFPHLNDEGVELLARCSGDAVDELKSIEPLPSAETIEAFTETLDGGTPGELVRLVETFARRAFVCGRLVPWKSDLDAVYLFFAECVEAEDHHLGLLAQFVALVVDPA